MESTYNLPGPNQDNNIYIYYDIESDIYESSFKSYVIVQDYSLWKVQYYY